MKALEYLDAAPNELVAHQRLSACLLMDDCIGGRVLIPRDFGSWRIQAFYRDDPAYNGNWLPNGLRRVIVPDGQFLALGISAARAEVSRA